MSPTPKDPRDLRADPGPARERGPGSLPDFAKAGSDAAGGAIKADTQSGNDFARSGDPPPAAPHPDAEKSYTVGEGDSLSAISKKFYGNASRWQEILEANRDQLDDPDSIRPGQTLRIP